MTNQANTDGLDIPAALRRTTNDKGITLSAGIERPATVTAAKAPAKPKAAAKAAKAPAKPKATKPAKAEAAPADGEQPAVKRSIVPKSFKDKYAKHGGTCGDDMALELKAATTTQNADKRDCLDLEALRAIASQNGLDGVLDGYIAKALNNGQLRMNIGNKLRGLLKAGTDVTIGTGKNKRVFKAEDMAT